METLDFILNGAETKRYHTWPTLREQTVGAHSFSVAMLVALIAQGADPHGGEGLTLPLIMAALTHDLAEHKLGDLPAPAKRSLPALANGMSFRAHWGVMEVELLKGVNLDWEGMLGPQQLRWLKLADSMDGALWCLRERAMGNTLIRTVFSNFRSYIEELSPHSCEETSSVVKDIIAYIDDMWEQAND